MGGLTALGLVGLLIDEVESTPTCTWQYVLNKVPTASGVLPMCAVQMGMDSIVIEGDCPLLSCPMYSLGGWALAPAIVPGARVCLPPGGANSTS